MPPKQTDLPGFSYNIVSPERPVAPAAPAYVNPPAPRVPYVNPGGNITLGEFAAGGARPNMYGAYDPAGASNLRAALPAQAAMGQTRYVPGQYGGALPAPSTANSALAIRPNAAPAVVGPMPGGEPAMKPAQVLNVRTIPGTGGATAPPMLGAGRAAAGAGSMLGRAIPFVGDVLQGAAYGYEGGSVGRGVAAGLGSLAGRVVGTAGGALTAPVTGPVGPIAGGLGVSAAGAYGGAKLYDAVFGEPEVAPLNEAQEFQKRKDMQSGDSPELRAARAQQTPAQLAERAEEARRDTRSNYPSYFEPAASRLDPVVMKKDPAPAKPQGFQGPSSDEMARFRRETGTPFDPKSINDKLNLDRMRAGEETFNSKQASAYRRSNPNYRPGQYSSGGSMARSPQTPAAPAATARQTTAPIDGQKTYFGPGGAGLIDGRPAQEVLAEGRAQSLASRPSDPAYDRAMIAAGLDPQTGAAPRSAVTAQAPAAQAPSSAPAASTPNMTLEQRGLARTVSSYDPATGEVTRNTSPRPTPAQMGAATRADYYQRYRNSRS
jgi:hypothetical protein